MSGTPKSLRRHFSDVTKISAGKLALGNANALQTSVANVEVANGLTFAGYWRLCVSAASVAPRN